MERAAGPSGRRSLLRARSTKREPGQRIESDGGVRMERSGAGPSRLRSSFNIRRAETRRTFNRTSPVHCRLKRAPSGAPGRSGNTAAMSGARHGETQQAGGCASAGKWNNQTKGKTMNGKVNWTMNGRRCKAPKRQPARLAGYPAPVAREVAALVRAGRKAPWGSKAAVLAYYLANEWAILSAKHEGRTSVGCAHGFRKAAAFSSKAELDSLRFGEDAVGLRALRFNGAHPAYKNGGGVPRPFRLVNGRLVRVSR